MPKRYKKNIIFSKSKLPGCYRYRDEFQIYPLDIERAPTSKAVNNLPCCFEFYYEEEDIEYSNPFGLKGIDKMFSEITTESNKRNRILNFLSTITNSRFHFNGGGDVIWTIPIYDEVTDENKDDINKVVSLPSFELYYYPGIEDDLRISGLSEKEQNQILRVPHQLYYIYDPVESTKKNICLPITINDILDKYYALDRDKVLVIDSASYQLCNALDLQVKMKSLSFFSAISAIETMIGLEYKEEKIEFECNECKSLKTSSRLCKKCGKPKWGIAEKFRDFLSKYVSDTKKSRQKFNKIYSIRSKIAHTEYLMLNENILDWNYTDKSKDLYTLHIEAIQLARLSIVNWLLKN